MSPLDRPVGDASALDSSPELVRVQILADALIYEGFVGLQGGALIHEELNDPRPFLNLTDAVIQDRNSASASHAPFVALNKGAITHVVLLTAESQDGEARFEPATPAKPSPPPAKSAAKSAASIAAARPQVPAAGPRTLPGPPPAPRGRLNDPPTQPFPRLSDGGVGDLILDDDGGDDIDPDDLERDGGALIAGAGGAE